MSCAVWVVISMTYGRAPDTREPVSYTEAQTLYQRFLSLVWGLFSQHILQGPNCLWTLKVIYLQKHSIVYKSCSYR